MRALFLLTAALFFGACAPKPALKNAPSPDDGQPPYRIAGAPKAARGQCVSLLKKTTPNLKIAATHSELVNIYYEEAGREGIRPDIAFAQALLETGSFTSERARKQNNFCGLGATDDGAAGAKFSNVRSGVRACVQHLKAYSSRTKPTTKIIDPRYYLVYNGKNGGRAKTWDDLTGKWATDRQYHQKIYKIYERILSE